MAQDRHAPEYRKGEFCARVPCEENDYIKICDPGWPAASVWQFAQRARGGGARLRTYEAHHILCWSPVKNALFADETIIEIIKGTKWCVNNGTNMIGLPLWGHTVKWYASSDDPPAFAGLPQHDRDHNCKGGYTAEVLDVLTQMADQLKRKKEKHELPPAENIATRLDNQSRKFAALIRARGARPPGTHLAFTHGESIPLWYLPFSMASDGVARPRKFRERKEAKWAAIKAAQRLLSGS